MGRPGRRVVDDGKRKKQARVHCRGRGRGRRRDGARSRVMLADAKIEEFDEDGKPHGEIDIALGDVLVEALGD
jgi:hypothetical protein